jgi:hypothetical protein
MSSFLKRRKSENEDLYDSENGTNTYRSNPNNTSSGDLPIFVPKGSDCVSPSAPQTSPFLSRRAPQALYRGRSYSRGDLPFLPTMTQVIFKYACKGTIIFLFCISIYHYDEVIPYARETINSKTLTFPPWLKFRESVSTKLESSRLENERLTVDLENLQAELRKATTLSTQISQENEKFKHAIALLEEENKELANEQQVTDLRKQTERLKEEIQKISRHEVFHR